MKRLFAAIKVIPDEQLLKVYYGLQSLLRTEKIKWVEPGNLHLTLKFFGETPESEIPLIIQSLNDFSNKHESFNLQFAKTGIFGSSYNPRVIWFGLSHEEKLRSLGNQLLSELNMAGFKTDRQNFVPHLTVARIKKIEHMKSFQMAIDKYKTFTTPEFHVREFILFESQLTPKGPHYIPLEKFNFLTENE